MNKTKNNLENNIKPIPIVFSCDDNYVQHLYCTITSLISNKKSSDNFVFYVLIDTLKDTNKSELEKLCNKNKIELNFIKINKEYFKICPISKDCPHISIATYYRFVLPSLLPNLDKILYLDSDITILKSISDLYDIDISDYYFGAVPDILLEENSSRLNIKRYCNAGIMLVNLKKWREDKIPQKLFEWTNNNIDKIKWVDQDVLNCVMQDKILYIDSKYNCQVGEYDSCYKNGFNKNAKNASILHHIGISKPWSYNCKSPLRFKYFKYLLKTPYALNVFKYIICQSPLIRYINVHKLILFCKIQFDLI